MRLSLFGYFISALIATVASFSAFASTVFAAFDELLEAAFPPTATAARIISEIPTLAAVAAPTHPSRAAVRSFETRRLARTAETPFNRMPALLAA